MLASPRWRNPLSVADQPLYTQQELDRKLLDAANCLRGPIDPADFKAYIFPLLFYKRISDTWRWEHKQALADYNGDEELAKLPENYRFVIPDGAHWDDVQKVADNVGAALQLALDRIQEANPEKLAGIFGGVQWADKNRLPEDRLVAVLDVFSGLKLDPESAPNDLLGNAYEYLLKNFADESGKMAGEFFTPRAVVRLMGRILDPKEGESICDPACGSGGLLIESVNEIREADGDPRTLRIYGQEINQTTAAIARMNLYLHGIETFEIKQGDTLRDPKLKTPKGDLQRFDMIVANPPFSLKNWGRDQWADDPFGRAEHGVPPANYADLAFVEHMVTVLKPETGRLAVIVPQGALFRGGAERNIRKSLITAGLVEAVIDLPPKLFYSTTIPASILVCRTAMASGKPEEVLFIDATRRFKKGTNQNELTSEDITGIISAYRDHSEVVEDLTARSVSHDELEGAEWDLTPSRYVEDETVSPVDVADAFEAYRRDRHQANAADANIDEQISLFQRATETSDEIGDPLPSAQTQEAVASLLSAIESARSALSQSQEAAQKLLDSLTFEICPTTRTSGEGVAVSSLATYINGRAFKPAEFTAEGLPVIRIKQLLDPAADLDRYDGSYEEKHFITDGDLIFSWSASLEVVRWNRGDALLNQHLFKVVENDGVDRGWLTYVLRSALKHFRQMTHGTTMKHITRSALDQVFVRRPPLEEQRTVARLLAGIEQASA